MLSSAQIMIIIITPLSFIPAMKTALLDGPNWKTIYVARMGGGGWFCFGPLFLFSVYYFSGNNESPFRSHNKGKLVEHNDIFFMW